MKTKEELYAIKEEVEALNKKLNELSDEELEQVTGGAFCDDNSLPVYEQSVPETDFNSRNQP